MLLQTKQWESKYLRDFDVVKNAVVSEEHLYNAITAMYYDYVSSNGIEPFTISYGRGKGFCINANSHVGVIVYDDITLYINSMIPNLTLGKILYLQSQAEDIQSTTETRKVIVDNLNDEETISAIDYFVVSLLQAVEEIRVNGLITEIQRAETVSKRLIGKMDIKRQISKSPAYEQFYVEKTDVSTNILLNRAIRTAIEKSAELTKLEWARPLLIGALDYFTNVSDLEEITKEDFPKVSDYTAIKRDDYEKALRFAKFILLGYDPLAGDGISSFPEFMIDMNEVFEYYVNVGLKRIFKNGFENKKIFSLGVGPRDIPIDRKNIELDGYYCNENIKVVLDTKNKYKNVLENEIPDFVAANPDIYQQYYYASRVNASNIILVYPSDRKRTAPIGEYDLNFERNKNVKMYFWALHITGSPKDNKRALINLAKFIETL